MNYDAANEGYRSFTRGAIAAAITINSGGLVALIAQAEYLSGLTEAGGIVVAYRLFTLGIAAGTASWIFGALSALAFAHGHQRRETATAVIGYLLVFSAIGLFVGGSLALGSAILPVVPAGS